MDIFVCIVACVTTLCSCAVSVCVLFFTGRERMAILAWAGKQHDKAMEARQIQRREEALAFLSLPPRHPAVQPAVAGVAQSQEPVVEYDTDVGPYPPDPNS